MCNTPKGWCVQASMSDQQQSMSNWFSKKWLGLFINYITQFFKFSDPHPLFSNASMPLPSCSGVSLQTAPSATLHYVIYEQRPSGYSFYKKCAFYYEWFD